MLLLEDLHEVLHHSLIEILSSQMGVTVGGYDLKNAIVDGQEGHIKGTSSKVVDQDVLLRLLVQTVGDGCRGGFVDDAQHVHPRNGASIFGGLALRIVEICGDSNNRMLHFFAQVVLGSLLHLGENHRRHLLGSHDLVLALDLHADHWLAGLVHDGIWQQFDVLLHRGILEASTNEALHVEQGLRGVDGGLVLGCLSDEPFIICEGHIGRGNAIALVVGDDLYSAILVNANARISGTEIDANHWSINLLVLFLCKAGGKKGQSSNSPHGPA
mmetsp:Transcript_66490/g.105215  ORF Transcript_66490/g.105215 Transcript_66490/m.105215 type:complete len:271 (-) Transcript_66490:42-854(-)